MSEVYNKCIMAPSASECASLLKQCAKGDKGCIDTFNKLRSDYAQGLRLSEDGKVTYIRDILVENGFGPYLNSGETNVDVIVTNWNNSLGASPEAKRIRENTELMSIFQYLVSFVIDPRFSGEPETMKTSSAWFPPRPTGAERVFSDLPFGTRPTKRVMTGGGSQRKSRSYVNKMRYLDSLNTYYNMAGGAVEPSNCSDELKVMYNQINSNLQAHGKQVEESDNRIIETMLNKFGELETKVAQIQENLKNLASVNGSNVSGVISSEKSKLSTESKYLSNQGKSITSIIRSLLESTDNIGDNNIRALTNARLQFPQHTTTY